MQERLTRLLYASPAVIYSFKARDDYAPIFVSGNIERLLGYSPDEYLKNADFWRERVHPDDLAGIEAEQTKLFENGQHTTEYRFRQRRPKMPCRPGSHCFSKARRRLSTASRQAATMRRPSSARTSSACSATAR